MKIVGILGTPRRNSNTEILLDRLLNMLESKSCKVEKICLRDLDIKPCTSCRACLGNGWCVLDDDMTRIVAPKLLEAYAIVVATPVHFDNVSALAKIFMDRTWWLRGKLRNKVLGCIVVGRGYGLDTALMSIRSWALKHHMIVGDRGVAARGFEYREVLKDERAMKDLINHAERLYDLLSLVHRGTEQA